MDRVVIASVDSVIVGDAWVRFLGPNPMDLHELAGFATDLAPMANGCRLVRGVGPTAVRRRSGVPGCCRTRARISTPVASPTKSPTSSVITCPTSGSTASSTATDTGSILSPYRSPDFMWSAWIDRSPRWG